MSLQKEYESICYKYIDKFCEKQDMEFSGWVGGVAGGGAICNDFYFNFHDIVWDINSKQRKGTIIKWYNESIDNPKEAISYYGYTKQLKSFHLK